MLFAGTVWGDIRHGVCEPAVEGLQKIEGQWQEGQYG